jgi:hypothetical protein
MEATGGSAASNSSASAMPCRMKNLSKLSKTFLETPTLAVSGLAARLRNRQPDSSAVFCSAEHSDKPFDFFADVGQVAQHLLGLADRM